MASRSANWPVSVIGQNEMNLGLSKHSQIGKPQEQVALREANRNVLLTEGLWNLFFWLERSQVVPGSTLGT